jgi:hypothetical protein
MARAYPLLVRRADSAAGQAVEDDFTLADLAKGVVVRDEAARRFFVFEGRPEFLAWYAARGGERYRRLEDPGAPPGEGDAAGGGDFPACHEVVLGRLPQRLKFDVDAAGPRLDRLELESGGFGGRAGGGLAPADLALLDELFGPEPPAEGGAEGPPADEAAAEAAAAAAMGAPPGEAARAAKARAALDVLVEAVLDELYSAYFGVEDGVAPTRDDIVVTDSSGFVTKPGGERVWKHSFHLLVLPFCVVDNEEARGFTERVLDRLPAEVRALVDPGVNSRVQNFRLVGSSKLGEGRPKRPSAEIAAALGTRAGAGVADLLVGAPPGARILPRVFCVAPGGRAPPPAGERLGEEALGAVLAAARAGGALAGHELSAVRDRLLCFRRVAPSFCRLCGEVHHRDNSLMVSVAPDGAGPLPAEGRVLCRLTELCRQAPRRGRPLGSVALDAAALRGGPRAVRAPAAREGGGPPAPGPAAPGPPAPGGGLRRAPPRPAAARGPPEEPSRAAAALAAQVAALRAGAEDPHEPSAFEGLPPPLRAVYAEPEMRPLELVPTLGVRAQMGLGKTKALKAYLARHFGPDRLEPAVVRIVSFRQTFSRAVAESFPDFIVYSDVQGDLDPVLHPRLIVQVESLHRLRPPQLHREPVDLLVLDESESVLAQFNSGLHKHFSAAFAIFRWMVATARHVVCLDANLGDRTFQALARLRPGRPPFFHWNRFARAAEDSFLFTLDQGAWLSRLYARLRAGGRVVVPSNSLAEARGLEEALRREFPLKRVALYSSETPPSVRAAHFGDVHRHWGGLDVLIFTPTCSAGVSFELPWFDALFGLFCDVSCDVETCRQMLGRVRSLADREFVVCLRVTRPGALPETTADIRRLLFDRRAALFRQEGEALQWRYAAPPPAAFDPNGGWGGGEPGPGEPGPGEPGFGAPAPPALAGPGFGLGLGFGGPGPGGGGGRDDGDGDRGGDGIVFYESDYFCLWLETVRLENLSRNHFQRRFVAQVADTGARVGVLGADDPPADPAGGALLLAAHRASCTALREARHAAVAAAPAIPPEEAARIREALRAQVDVPPQDRLAFERFALCEAFDWHGRPVSGAFVGQYSPPGVRRVFRALRQITAAPSVGEALAAVRAAEAANFAYVTEGGGSDAHESRDLLHGDLIYSFRRHQLALWVLGLCGFAFGSRARVHAATLAGHLRRAAPRLLGALEALSFEFDLGRGARGTLRRALADLASAEDPPARPGAAGPFVPAGPDPAAAEPDAALKFVAATLRVVNPVLRAAYGIQVTRGTKRQGLSDSYALGPNAVGKLFAVLPPGVAPDPLDLRPHVASRLAGPPPAGPPGHPLGVSEDDLTLFLDRAEAGRPPTPPPADPALAAAGEVDEPDPRGWGADAPDGDDAGADAAGSDGADGSDSDGSAG